MAALALLILLLFTGAAVHFRASGATAAIPSAGPAPNPGAWSDDALSIANLGHATLLMNYFGVRVISDPTLYDRVGLAFGSILTIGPQRYVAAPLAPSALGPIDLILVTHAHMDHLDLPSLETLPKSTTVIACAKCGALIRPLGFEDVRELDWGESTSVKGLTVTAMAARHWGKRWPPYGTAYGFNSYVLEREGRRMLLACDSAYTDAFAVLAQRPPAVAAFSIGAYDPWIHNHADPEQVWAMFRQSGARYLVPIHWGIFRLSKEPMDEPLHRLLKDAGPNESAVVLRRIGGSWTMPSEPPSAGRAGTFWRDHTRAAD